MFSKEWKLVVLALAAVTCLTACPNHKKQSEDAVPFRGLWVNQKAHRELFHMVRSGNSHHFCQRIYSNPAAFGISVVGGSASLDAWQITNNGSVYIYSATGDVPVASRYQGRVTSVGGFVDRDNKSVNSYGMIDTGAMSGPNVLTCGQSPFINGASQLWLDGEILKVRAYRSVPVRYVRTDVNRLRELNMAIAECSDRLNLLPPPCQAGNLGQEPPIYVAPPQGQGYPAQQLPSDSEFAPPIRK